MFFKIINKLLVFLMLAFIKVYQYCISPFLHANCRFSPTCSAYAYQSFKTHGFSGGMKFTLKRLVRCHPWGGYGYDPVPKLQDKIKDKRKYY